MVEKCFDDRGQVFVQCFREKAEGGSSLFEKPDGCRIKLEDIDVHQHKSLDTGQFQA